jgi:hypothetical protein
VAAGKLLEDTQDHGRLPRLEHHPVAVRTRTSLLVHAHLADRHGLVAKGPLAHRETALFLTDLAAQGLLAQVL